MFSLNLFAHLRYLLVYFVMMFPVILHVMMHSVENSSDPLGLQVL
jgi:hypothetical protein